MSLASSLKSTNLGKNFFYGSLLLPYLRLTVKIFQFLRLPTKFLAVLRLSVNPIETFREWPRWKGIIILFTRLIVLGSSTYTPKNEMRDRRKLIQCFKKNLAFAICTSPIMNLPLHPGHFLHIRFVFNLGVIVVSREIENNACALEAGQTRCIMGDVQMVNITNFAVLLFFCYSMRC